MAISIKQLIPRQFHAPLKRLRAHFEQAGLAQERKIFWAGHELLAPRRHMLHGIGERQPFRDKAVGFVARAVKQFNDKSVMLDIGANIGDTLASVREVSDITVHCVEPHPKYFGFLERNAAQFKNIGGLHKVLIGDGGSHHGDLLVGHSSTARFHPSDDSKKVLDTVMINELGIRDIMFVKIDTDGFDNLIIKSHMKWLAKNKPALMFECEVRSPNILIETRNLVTSLLESGYKYWCIFDDPGYMICATDDVDTVNNIINYLYATWVGDKCKRISNLDIVCLPITMKSVMDKIVIDMRTLMSVPA